MTSHTKSALAQYQQALQSFCIEAKLNHKFLQTALKWYLPLLDNKLLHQVNAKRPVFIGVNGSQGSGKTSLTACLAYLTNNCTPYSALTMSLDDFYLSRQHRQDLAQTIHPLLATRGVPGTHDTDKLATCFELLEQGAEVSIPRFDKASDNPFPAEQAEQITAKLDFIFVEGWCWGATPQTTKALQEPINRLEAEQDRGGEWRRFVNQSLAQNYLPLYQHMQYWIMLQAPSFDVVYQWRCEQEGQLRQARQSDAQHIMSDAQIASFIAYFQRLTEHCLRTLPPQVDCCFTLNTARQITQVNYQ